MSCYGDITVSFGEGEVDSHVFKTTGHHLGTVAARRKYNGVVFASADVFVNGDRVILDIRTWKAVGEPPIGENGVLEIFDGNTLVSIYGSVIGFYNTGPVYGDVSRLILQAIPRADRSIGNVFPLNAHEAVALVFPRAMVGEFVNLSQLVSLTREGVNDQK